jgi:APA family basic amino acid/polyamine antiporter
MANSIKDMLRGHGQLLRILGVAFGISIAIGNMIGAGVLRAPAAIAGTVPDPVIIIGLWVLGGLHAALGINILAEMGTAIPQSGGMYLYARRALGDVAGLVVGWSDLLSKFAGIAATSIAFAEFLPIVVPGAAAFKTAVAIVVQILLYAVNAFGLREGRAVQEISSFVKTLLLLVFIGAAIAVAAPHDTAAAHSASEALGWATLIGAYALIKGAYSGYQAPVYFTEENQTPGSSIPRALGIGLLVTTLLYVGVNAGLIYALGVEGVASSPLPFNMVLDRIGGSVPGIIFAIGAMIAVAGVSNAGIMTGPRLIFAMSRDGLLPRFFQYVNRGGNPDAAMLLVAVGSLSLAASGSFALVFGLIALTDTVGAMLINASYFVLRAKEPDLPRPFRAWGHPWLPGLLLVVDAILLVLFAGSDWKGLAFVAGLSVLCVPFAIVGRRARVRE